MFLGDDGEFLLIHRFLIFFGAVCWQKNELMKEQLQERFTWYIFWKSKRVTLRKQLLIHYLYLVIGHCLQEINIIHVAIAWKLLNYSSFGGQLLRDLECCHYHISLTCLTLGNGDNRVFLPVQPPFFIIISTSLFFLMHISWWILKKLMLYQRNYF